MEQLKAMKESLMAAAQSQMGNLDCVDAEELGQVIDMIKDLEEAIYYCSVVKAMEDRKKELEQDAEIRSAVLEARSQDERYYTPMRYYEPWRMYYGGGNGGSSGNGGSNSGSNSGGYSGSSGGDMGGVGRRGYDGRDERRSYDDDYRYMIPSSARDYREGRSYRSRRGYMESKESHADKNVQMQELETYMQELGQDIAEMINDASPEEKNMLRDKLNKIVQKVV